MSRIHKSIEPMKLKEIGTRLRSLRDALNITLERMNELTGISRSYISDFERGRKLPSSKYLFYLIENFTADINHIYTGRGGMFLREVMKDRKNCCSFGKYEEEINDLLYHITRIPNALFSVLGYFSDYKVNKEKFIKNYLEKIEGINRENRKK